MSSSPPTTLGKYQIIREIARSNDIVYEAYDPLMNRRVAIKELAMPSGANQAQKDDRLKRFLREARAAGSLAHPNIMTVFEVGEDAGKHFIAMEYLDGHTLRNELDTKGFLPPDEAIGISEKVLNALEYAHSKGIIHRDIKPDNIQLLSDGSVKITDFGIARLTFEPNLTMDGQVFGTPSYMSPEQVVGREIDARSDLFSVGVLLYEMIAGQKPFAGDSVVSITYAIMNKEPDRPNQANFALWQVIEKSLDKSPQLRYPNAREMLAALENAQKAVQPGSVVIDPGKPLVGGTLYQPNQTGMYGAPPVYPPQAYPPQPMNPYGAPAYGQPMPPPVVYPYNPYQQGTGGSAAPHTPSYSQPYSQAPIYYPPPPRKPLLSPEARFFLGRVILVLTVAGIVLGMVVLFINAMSQWAERQRPSAPAPVTSPVAQAKPAENPPAQPAQADKAQQQEADAEGYRSAARASESDAQQTQNHTGKATAYEDAVVNWLQASDSERQPTKADDDKTSALTDAKLAADELVAAGERPAARKYLESVRSKFAPGSKQEAGIGTKLEELRQPAK